MSDTEDYQPIPPAYDPPPEVLEAAGLSVVSSSAAADEQAKDGWTEPDLEAFASLLLRYGQVRSIVSCW